MSARDLIRLEAERLAAVNAARISRIDAAVDVIAAVLGAITAAVLLVRWLSS